jgi:hypothetical protein
MDLHKELIYPSCQKSRPKMDIHKELIYPSCQKIEVQNPEQLFVAAGFFFEK